MHIALEIRIGKISGVNPDLLTHGDAVIIVVVVDERLDVVFVAVFIES